MLVAGYAVLGAATTDSPSLLVLIMASRKLHFTVPLPGRHL